jgi:very-short-patch-repair endonuclease/arsenate reductase-like glutaredoxin family protein
MSKSEIIKIIQIAFSINDVSLQVYGYTNGSSIKKIKNIIEENNIDISHFKIKNKNRKYNIIERKCPVCETIFKVNENDEKTTCSFSCSNKYFRGIKSELTKNKISNSLKVYNQLNTNIKSLYRICSFCGSKYERKRLKSGILSNAKTCSESCKIESIKINMSNSIKKRIDNGTHTGWQSRNIISYPEQFFINVLINNNINYEFNYPINKRKDLLVDEPYNYFLDFYFPEKKMVLEIDGKQHKYRVEHDKVRDERLSNVGIKVFRIKWKSINNDSGRIYIKNEIDKFLNFYKNS